MRVLVCGSRDYNDTMFLFKTLDALHAKTPITLVIEGEAKGADRIGRGWANENGIEVVKFPAEWQRFGRAAGPKRNRQMLVEGNPELVVGFLNTPREESRGTANMLDQAERAGVETEWYIGRIEKGKRIGYGRQA